MKKKSFGLMLLVAFMINSAISSAGQQAKLSPKGSEDLPRYEVGADFSTLTRYSDDTTAGGGGRFTYNLNRHVALEAAGYFFGASCARCSDSGHVTEGLFGVKAGQRFKKFGIFGKARPGFINYSKGYSDIFPTGGSGPFPFLIVVKSRMDFATDVGGVLEVYPKKRLLLRFDGSVIFDRFGRHTFHYVNVDPATGALLPATFTNQAFTSRYFQFIGGVGFRF